MIYSTMREIISQSATGMRMWTGITHLFQTNKIIGDLGAKKEKRTTKNQHQTFEIAYGFVILIIYLKREKEREIISVLQEIVFVIYIVFHVN